MKAFVGETPVLPPRVVRRVRAGVLPVETWSLPSREGATFRYVDIGSVDRDSKRITRTETLLVADAPSRARQLLETGDVLVSTVRPNLNAVAIVPADLAGSIGSTGFTVLRADCKQLLPRFLYHWVRSPNFIADMVKKATGASYPAVSDRIVLNSIMPMPQLDEQRRVAEMLDKADAIRRKRREAITLTEELLRSAFVDMFGDIPARRSEWPFRPLREFLLASSGKSSKPVLSEDETSIPVYGGNGVNGWATEALYKDPVVVVGRVGQQCGITRMTDGPAWVTDNAIVVSIARVDVLNPVYLMTALQHSPLRASVMRLDLPFINQSTILDFPLPLPPLLLQQKFAELRTRLLKSQSRLESSHEHGERLFGSLVKRAFSGQFSTEEDSC